MAKIAVEYTSIKRDDEAHTSPAARTLASGEGWTIRDVLCTAGPHSPVFQEQHSQVSIAFVLSGTFQYQTSTGHELMTPGSILLGNPGDSFACSHQHGIGDRCISFHYTDELQDRFELNKIRRPFKIPRIPPIRSSSPLVADISLLAHGHTDHAMLHQIAFRVFDQACHLQHGLTARQYPPPPSSLARTTRVLRAIEQAPEAGLDLSEMAAIACLSPYHFLRCFDALTGTTPRQFILRLRLRRAAIRLKQDTTKILDIALDCGFGDLSNFNRAFRAEFGTSPRTYRRT